MQMQLLREEVEILLSEINEINRQTLATIEKMEANGNELQLYEKGAN